MRNQILLGSALIFTLFLLFMSMGGEEKQITNLQERCQVLSRKHEKQYLPLMGTLLRFARLPAPACQCPTAAPCGCPKSEEQEFYLVLKSPQSKAQEIPVFTKIKDDYMMANVKTNQDYSMCIRVEAVDSGGVRSARYVLDFFNTLKRLR